MIAFDFGKSHQHQFCEEVPTALIPTAENREPLLRRYNDFHEKSTSIHRSYRQSFIAGILESVKTETIVYPTSLKDQVSENTWNEKHNPEFFDYGRVESHQRNAEVLDLDCINVNPNSYKTVQEVLDKILLYTKETGRKYLPVVMDGTPFCMSINIIRNTYICSTCNSNVELSVLKDHEKSHGNASPTFVRRFKPILIRPGSGHIEMNAVRTIISFFWIPFIQPIAKLMGFKTEAALNYAKKGLDHHKSYNLLM